MPKQRQFLKPQKGKHPPPEPETADEFLAAGVDFEEAGEKWRAGDAAKSCRFFMRAIEAYESGLKKFPHSFDLAYNKARIQYDLSQQPRLLHYLPTNVLSLLQASLESHRYALNLKGDDTNTLFNTAQVLTSIGETFIESSSFSKDEAAPLLQEALDLFQKCLEVQEVQLAESEARIAATTTMDPSSSSDPASYSTQGSIAERSSPTTSSPTTEEQWATIVEPTTKDTLFDTCLAQIQTLATLVPLSTPTPSTFEILQNVATSLFSKASSYTQSSVQQTSISLARFNLLATLSDLQYRSSLLSPSDYLNSITTIFSEDANLSATPSAPALCDLADVLIAFNASLATTDLYASIPFSAEHSPSVLLPLRWKALSSALSSLASADALPSATGNRSAINARRAEVELLRIRLEEGPSPYGQAWASRDTMLHNAQTYYKGARKIAGIEGDLDAEQQLGLRWAVVLGMKTGDWTGVEGELGNGIRKEDLEAILEEMRDEGLIGEIVGKERMEND